MTGFTLWISRRLKLNGSGRGANATGVAIAVAGVALALIIMEFTIAIVLGFKNGINERILGFDGEMWVLPDYDYNTAASAPSLVPDERLLAIIDSVVPGAQLEMRYEQPGILKTDNDFSGVYFTGFDPGHDYAFERGNIIEGELPDFTDPENSDKLVISKMMAKSLQLAAGDRINACFFINDAIKARRFVIAGIYESGFGDFDRTVAYAPIGTLRRVAAADSLAGTRLSVDVPAGIDIAGTAASLQEAIINAYQDGRLEKLYPVDNVRHTGALYFNWLELLNTNVVVIFILMLCVSGFTLVSSMFIIILERIPTIGILRALGTSKSQIRSIFVYMTLKIVGLGLLIGNVVGIGLLLLQREYNILTLDPEMYYLRYVPVEMNYRYFLYLNIGIVFVSWLILILPSRVASSVSPASTMRFE